MGRFSSKGFPGLLKDVKNQPQLRDTLKKARANVFLYDKNGHTTKAKRARALKEYTEISKVMLVAEGQVSEDISDQDLFSRCFNKDNIVDFACQYLAALACSDHIEGRIEKKIQAAVLRERAESLWWYASWELQFNVITVYPVWDQTTSALIHQHAVVNGLSTSHRAKHYFGIPELRLLFNALFLRMRKLPWWKQNYLAWTLTLMTGVRPGSIGVSRGCDPSQCLHWEDIEFLPNFDGAGKLAVRIHFRWLKGKRDLHRTSAKTFKPLTFLIESPLKPCNLIADLPSLLLCTAQERGLFGNDETISDLLASPLFRLQHNTVVTKLPVFVCAAGPNNQDLHRTHPMHSSDFNTPLKDACREVGLQCRVSMYVWRREFLTSVARNASNDVARQYADHTYDDKRSSTLEDYYDYGPGDQNITALRLGECLKASTTLRNRMRQLLDSSAIHRRAEYPFQEEEDYVTVGMAGNDSVGAFNDVVNRLMTCLTTRLGVSLPESHVAFDRLLDTNAPPQGISRHVAEERASMSFSDFANPINFVTEADTTVTLTWAHARSIWRLFQLDRKLVKKYHKSRLQAEFRVKWESESQNPAGNVLQTVVEERRQAAEAPPAVLQSIPNVVTRTGQLVNKLDVVADDSDDDNGCQSDDNEDDQYFAPLDALKAGTCVDLSLDGEREAESALADVNSVEVMRRDLQQQWLGLTSLQVSSAPCTLCNAQVIFTAGSTVFPSAKLCRHLESEQHHGTHFQEYMQFCLELDRYHCRLCTKEVSKSNARRFRIHLQEQHTTLYARLTTI